MSTDPLHRAEQRQAFRFDKPIKQNEVPAIATETEARIERMCRLQRDAWDACDDESDLHERRGCLSVFYGTGTEIENLHKHLERCRELLT